MGAILALFGLIWPYLFGPVPVSCSLFLVSVPGSWFLFLFLFLFLVHPAAKMALSY